MVASSAPATGGAAPSACLPSGQNIRLVCMGAALDGPSEGPRGPGVVQEGSHQRQGPAEGLPPAAGSSRRATTSCRAQQEGCHQRQGLAGGLPPAAGPSPPCSPVTRPEGWSFGEERDTQSYNWVAGMVLYSHLLVTAPSLEPVEGGRQSPVFPFHITVNTAVIG